ncbi:UBN2 domain-containing protein [Tanacetum coccineum]
MSPNTIGNPQLKLQEKGVINSGCSRHMTGNKSYLSDYKEIDGGFVAFGGNPNGGKITGKGKIRTRKLDFEDVYFVKELKFNLFSVSQMCDKKNSVLFTDTECVILSSDFKLLDESQALLRVPRKNNMYSVDLKNIVPSGGLTCLFAKATLDESNLSHRRLEHINFKTMNKLVRGNLVRGLPSKIFENDHTCVACQKGKQHKASFKDNKIDLLVQQYEQFVISEDESIDSAFARFNTIITSLKALDEGYSSKNYVRKFLRALHPKRRAKSKIKAKVERKYLALKAKKESSDEECSTFGSEDEEYAMASPKDKNQRAFVGGSWSDSGEENDEKIHDETCLVAQAPNEVCSESSYFSDENSSINDIALDNEYDKLCKMTLKIITKNKRFKATRNSLENELRELKDKLSTLDKNKGVDLDCVKCHVLKIKNEKLKDESTRLNKFEKSTHCLNEMLSNQKPFSDKLGLGFNSFEASSSRTKKTKFVKA